MQHLFVQPSWNTDLIPSNSPQSTAVTAVCVHARGHASACLPACLSVCLFWWTWALEKKKDSRW